MILSSYVSFRAFLHIFDEEEDKEAPSRRTWDITAFLLRRRQEEEASVWSKRGEEVSSSLLLFRRCSSSSSSFILGNHLHRFRP